MSTLDTSLYRPLNPELSRPCTEKSLSFECANVVLLNFNHLKRTKAYYIFLNVFSDVVCEKEDQLSGDRRWVQVE